MNITPPKNSILVCALLGAMIATTVQGANIRYRNSGDYLSFLAAGNVGANGWENVAGVPGLPGAADTARFNWGSNTVTLAGVAPLINNFQMGVDESGQLVVNSGGKLITKGNSTVGNSSGSNAGVVGRLTVNTGGEVIVTNVLFVGNSAANNVTGILTVNGGTVSCTSHLWAGSGVSTTGFIYLTNGGTLNIGANIGLGTVNASTPSGSTASLFVQDGGVLNLNTISGTTQNSIHPGSKLDISGSGVVTIPGDKVSVMNGYIAAGRITANGGAGTVGVDYNNTNSGKTTLYVIAGYIPPTAVVWNPAGNPSGTGKWNEATNWTGSLGPTNVTKVTFNVSGAIPCTVTNAAFAKQVVMGDNGPGGTLIVTNGGSLTASSTSDWSAIGYNNNALMVVESGGAATFAYQLWIGFSPGSDGTLLMKGGTVTVSNMIGLGWSDGKGTVQVNGGTLNLLQWDDANSIKGASVLDVTATGAVVITGDRRSSVSDFVTSGKITAYGGTGTVVVVYNNTNPDKTTLIANRIPTGSDIETTVALGDSVTIPIIGGKFAPTDLDVADIPNLIVSAVGGSPTRGSASFTSTNVTYTSSGVSSGADSFTYTVSDQRGGTVTKTVMVTVSAGGNGANVISLTGTVPNITVHFAGLPGSTYAIDRATSPSGPWSEIAAGISTAANGQASFLDTSAPSPTGFYRTRYVSTP